MASALESKRGRIYSGSNLYFVMYSTFTTAKLVQNLSLGLFRSDYMVHQTDVNGTSTVGIKQVEFNTIASSFGGLSSQTSALHK